MASDALEREELLSRLTVATAKAIKAEVSLSALGTPAALRALGSLPAPPARSAVGASAPRQPAPRPFAALASLFSGSDEGTLRSVFAVSLLGLLLLLASGAVGGGGSAAAPAFARAPPPRAAPPPAASAGPCASLCEGGANITVRVPIVHPSHRVSYGFSDSIGTRAHDAPDEWGISYNIGPGVPAASALQIPCGVLVFSDVAAVNADYFLGRVVQLSRAEGAYKGAPERNLLDHNLEEVLAEVEAAPPPPPRVGDTGGRPVFFYVDTGPRNENFAHWEGETAIFLERWRCVRAHYPAAKLLLEHRNRFKVMVLSALFDVAEADIATVRSWGVVNGATGAGAALPCEGGNVVVLPPLMMLNQWATDLPMQGALVVRYFGGYAAKFGLPRGCARAPPAAAGAGALLMLPHGRINAPFSLEEYTQTIDHEFSEIHHRNTSYEAAVLAMVKALGGDDFYGAEANNARLQLEVLRRARVVVTSYGTSMFHNSLLARGATFIVMVGRVPLHHVQMPTFGEWVRAAAKWNAFHFIMGAFDTERVRELVAEALAAPPLPCPIPEGAALTYSCMRRNKAGPYYESSFDVCE